MLHNYLIFIFVLLSISNSTLAKEKPEIKNLILVIGDGMGYPQINLLNQFLKFSKANKKKNQAFAFERLAKMGTTGISTNHPQHFLVTDSACSASLLATGQQSLPGAIGVNAKGYSAKSIFEMAKEKGMSTGLVSDTRITHATPASFVAHHGNRRKENNIAKQILASNTDIMLSAGIDHFLSKKNLDDYTSQKIPYSPRRKDAKDLLKQAKAQSYELVFNKQEFSKTKSSKILGLFAGREMPDGIWYTNNKSDKKRSIPSLSEMSLFAIEKLAKNPKGFVLMIEAGQIDWAGHRNDGALLLHQMLEANESLNNIIDWVEKRKDTALVVTADHETGGFNFSYHKGKKVSLSQVNGPHYKKGYKSKTNFLTADVLDRMYEQKTSIASMISKSEKHPADLSKESKLRMILTQNSSWELSEKQAKELVSSGEWLGKTPHRWLSESYYTNNLYKKIGAITHLLAPQNGISFSTSGHTAGPVPVFAISPGSLEHQKYEGWQHHTDIGKKMQDTLRLN